MSEPLVPIPRLWHLPRAGRHAAATVRRVLVGRQGIFHSDRTLYGYEMLYRAPGRVGLRVDLWNIRQQDRATEHVLAAAFFSGEDLGGGLPLFVNFTGDYLLDRRRYLHPPDGFVIEVVESAHADEALFARLAELREQGYRIALDDFVGTESQKRLMQVADYIKVDYRDFERRGDALLELARAEHAQLVAEHVETPDAFEDCASAGFDLFQGHLFEPALVVERAGRAAQEHDPVGA